MRRRTHQRIIIRVWLPINSRLLVGLSTTLRECHRNVNLDYEVICSSAFPDDVKGVTYIHPERLLWLDRHGPTIVKMMARVGVGRWSDGVRG